MRYAIIESGGKQFVAREGETIDVDRLTAEPGQKLQLREVLLVVDGSQVRVGTPLVDGASVAARVVEQRQGPKVMVFRYKAKERQRRRTGHRQQLTRLAVERIEVPGMQAEPDEPKPAARKSRAAKQPAARKPAAKAAPAAKKTAPKKK
jgi:large subunit ribosomal protein L21